MAVKNLLKLMEKKNIANDLSESELAIIANDVLERAQEDLASMKDWMSCVDEGLELCRPEFEPKSDPWDGAANYKSNILSEAANDFGNRGVLELMRERDLVKVDIIGLQTLQNVINKKSDEVLGFKEQLEAATAQMQQLGGEIPPEVQKSLEEIGNQISEKESVITEKKSVIQLKKQRADRVAELMNWQINVKMPEWRKDQKRLMYTLPNVGSMFKKTYYDEAKGRCVSDIINYPNFIVNQATVSLPECRSFTHIIDVSKVKCKARMKSGVWRKCELVYDGDNDDSMTNEANGVLTASKNPDCFYEQYCWLDLDDDGYEEPYIVTVHKASSQVVRIVARFDYQGIIVKFEDMKPMPLLDAQRKRAERVTAEAQELGTIPELPDPYDLTGYEVICIEPKGIISKFGFMPSQDGTYLDVGFFHKIGALTMAENKVTNDLLNSGTLANNQMGMTAKGFRKRQGDFKFKMGQLMATEIPPEQLQQSIYMLNFKEPSPTLFQLRESIKMASSSFVATSDMAGQIQSNTAPTTALAMIQEAMTQHSAHISMVIDSLGEEFKILFDLNRYNIDGDEYKKIVGDDDAVYADDFSEDNLSICCSANPEMSSKTQRMILADAELAQVPLVMQAGGNPIPIIKNYYKSIGSTDIESYFPNEAEMSPSDRAQMQQMQQLQDQQNQLKQQELELKAKEVEISNLQVALLSRSEDRKDAEFELNKHKILADVDSTLEDVNKKSAETKKIEQETQSLVVRTNLDVLKTENDIDQSAPVETVDPTNQINAMVQDAAREIKQIELNALRVVENILAPKPEIKEPEFNIAELLANNTKTIQELAETLKPKPSKIVISKQEDGTYVGVKE